ncbi:MFS transporter [Streptomyces sp. NPDC001606]
MQTYRQVLSVRGLKPVLLLGLLAKIPVVAIPIVLTLRVTVGLDLSYAQAGLVTGAWTVGVAIGAPVQGRVIDRRGLRPLFVVATVGQALFWGLAPLLPYPVLVVAALLSGLVLVPGSTLGRLAISGLVPEEQQHTAFAVDSILTNISYMTGPALAVLVSTQLSTGQALLGVGTLLLVSGSAIALRNPPVTRKAAPAGAGERPGGYLTAGLVAALACVFVSGAVSSGTELAIVGSLKDAGQVGWTSPVLVGCGICSIVGGLLYGSLKKSPPAALILLLMGVTTAPLGLAHGALWLGLALIPATLLYAPTFASTAAAVSSHADDSVRATVMSLYSVAMTAGTALGSLAAGLALDHTGPAGGFATVGGLAVAVALITWPVARRTTARSDRPASATSTEPETVGSPQ